jgi:hypothetical protein
MLEKLLAENYTNDRLVKAYLHIISHYSYSEVGERMRISVISLLNHQNKGIRKFAIKVFDNWNSIETLELLKGSQEMKESWLNKYRQAIIDRLEGLK